jgi:sugar/nucleoside kinase (ribokinase family)
MKIVFVGHVCVDQNVVRGQTETLYGGGVVHGAITTRRLGAEAVVITKCAPADRGGFQHLLDAGVQVLFLESPASTSIRNVYPTDNPEDRQSSLISRAAPFTSADLDGILDLEADFIHINPLWLGEFPPALLSPLRQRARALGADAQGLLRVPQPDGRMLYRDLPGKKEILSALDLFKVDSNEALLLTGEEDPIRAVRAVQALGPKIVLLTHARGVCVFDGDALHQSSFGPYTLEGRTGRGDTCTASFLVGRSRGMDLAASAAFAADVTSQKLQYRGPFRGL